MARLEKKVLGDIVGRVGNIVGKSRNGKYYIASRPSQYTMSMAPHEVDKRGRFKVNGQFARIIKQTEPLYKIWEKEKAPATNAYNKICKINFRLCRPERPSAENVITPPGFKLPVTKVNPETDRIEAALDVFELLETEKVLRFILIISFYNPTAKQSNYYEICRLVNYEMEELKLIFSYGSYERKLEEHYQNKTIYLAAVTGDGSGNIIRWSDTYSVDL